MSKTRRVLAVLFGLVGILSTPAGADPPLSVPAPIGAPSVPSIAPNVVPIAPPHLSPEQQKAALLEAQRAPLHRLAQATEREAARQARAWQFDKAQRLYAKAAALYHQQARLARRSAQDMAKSGQMKLAARAHAEALSADTRFLACLASEVSAIKKSSLAEELPPKRLPPAKPKPVLTKAFQPKLIPSAPEARHLPKPIAMKPLPPSIAIRPQPTAKPRLKVAKAKLMPSFLHAARARKALPPALKALQQAAVRPLRFAPGFIAVQQHGLLQERLRLRRAQLQGTSAGTEAQPITDSVAPPNQLTPTDNPTLPLNPQVPRTP